MEAMGEWDDANGEESQVMMATIETMTPIDNAVGGRRIGFRVGSAREARLA